MEEHHWGGLDLIRLLHLWRRRWEKFVKLDKNIWILHSPYALNNITWCCAIGTPNVFLPKEYFVASSRALCARPTAPAEACRHNQQYANGNHHGFYHVTGAPRVMQSLRSWRFCATWILCKSTSSHPLPIYLSLSSTWTTRPLPLAGSQPIVPHHDWPPRHWTPI
jgi:hypothetical protein